MTLRMLNIKQMEKKANEPSYSRKNPRAHRGTLQKISRAGRVKEPNVVPTEKDRERFGLLSPDEVKQGYQVKWAEPEREPLSAEDD